MGLEVWVPKLCTIDVCSWDNNFIMDIHNMYINA